MRAGAMAGSEWGERGTVGAAIAASVDIVGLSHAYGARQVLQDIDLAVSPGEIVALLGPSGCGKSTLLRLIAGVERPVSGTVALDGKIVSGPSTFLPPEERNVGLIFQDFALFPHMTNLANVRFGLRRLQNGEAAAIARSMLERVGLGRHASGFPGLLSGGEQQRVALARAIAPRPRVLLMDEPFSGLDRRLRDVVRDETLTMLKETRITAVFVTHDPEEAMRVADRIVLMRGGRIVQVGSAEELYTNPVDLQAARFFSEINEVEAAIDAGSVVSPLGVFPAPALPDGPAILALRPHAIRLSADQDSAGLSGRVLMRHFLGEVDAVEVAVDGLDAPLRVRLRANANIRVGEEVRVMVDPGEVLVFPEPCP